MEDSRTAHDVQMVGRIPAALHGLRATWLAAARALVFCAGKLRGRAKDRKWPRAAGGGGDYLELARRRPGAGAAEPVGTDDSAWEAACSSPDSGPWATRKKRGARRVLLSPPRETGACSGCCGGLKSDRGRLGARHWRLHCAPVPGRPGGRFG